ncbi:MAG: hypothetical protein DRR16_26500 [Candidatus Parabeggiatoa sp. nov. 3]|jgi:hypothetical protein|nr:MAG: hypothetical protein DRR00_05110 [Gammaproteobacteria bacterium]RKZ60367.1 MAG: hypothetical protein DRQ99_22200 [Gammaproteobacteria bacterium]RKZ79034.1 MAG: hypothetical protein DRR16_26500 [Gammaproteobacteria bacterium]
MSKKDLENFLNQDMENTQANVDWLSQRNEWLRYIELFYDRVLKWLVHYIEQGKIQVTRRNITLNEDNIGSYCTEKLILKLANKEVSLTPIGTVLIGSKGRIDMSSSAGEVKFVLVEKDSKGPSMQEANEKLANSLEWKWKISTSPPSIQFIELNEESFSDALLEVLNV